MPGQPSHTTPPALDAAVTRVKEAAPGWARATLRERIDLARALHAGVARTAERGVRLACQAKGLPWDGPQAGEEWLSGPYVTLRLLRLTIASLTLLGRNGNTPVGPLGETADGHLTVGVFPSSLQDRALFLGVRADVHLQEGLDEAALHERRARFHRQPDHDGRTCLVLGAGNINAIPPTDVITKLFNEGKTCLLKMNPVNAYLGPVLEEAFAPAVERGLLAVVYGGAEVGAVLCAHPGVDEVHITGSDRTHDLIVWGPPGAARDARRARGEPLLRKEITSELGCVSPVLVVPGPWDERRLAFQAESVAGMVTHNASFNCNAAKLLITPRGWRHRQRFLDLVVAAMARAPARAAWYPGAVDRYQALTAGRPGLRLVGQATALDPGAPPQAGAPGAGTLPWTLVPGLDAASADPAFTTEPFCAVLSETSVGSEDPVEFLAEATRFANQRVWGTLSASLVVHPATAADPTTGAALERAVRALRYGCVSLDVWAGYAFAFGTTPWGAYPGASLADIQSGRGFVHNALMLDGVEKCVVRHPAFTFPKPPYFPSHRTASRLGRRLTALEGGQGWGAVPAVVAAAVLG
ncbi:MAG: aldehyde dehydrogenase [Anaeromyxobacter sp.]|nr:aldehyde dehydrogenase [Anaeromyxobacter sp.]